MEREKRDKNFKKLNCFLLVGGIALIVLSLFAVMNRPLKVEEFDIRFAVGETTGVSLNSSALDFGRIIPGSSILRKVDIKNTYDTPLKVRILVSKGFSELVFTDSKIIIPAQNTTAIPITLRVPKNLSLGNYTGKIKFELWKASIA